jgi:hypothetical protein
MFKNVIYSAFVAFVISLVTCCIHPDGSTPFSELENSNIHWWILTPVSLPMIHLAWNFCVFMITENIDDGD